MTPDERDIRWTRWLWLSAAVIILDQLTKHAVLASFRPGEQEPVTSFFSLVLAFNSGAAFSFLADADGWQADSEPVDLTEESPDATDVNINLSPDEIIG